MATNQDFVAVQADILVKKLSKKCLPTLVDVRVDRKGEAPDADIRQVDI